MKRTLAENDSKLGDVVWNTIFISQFDFAQGRLLGMTVAE
jgi:hypothetical protein